MHSGHFVGVCLGFLTLRLRSRCLNSLPCCCTHVTLRLFRRVSLCLSRQIGSSVEMLARARPLDIKGVEGPLSEH